MGKTREAATENERRLREAIAYADAFIRDPASDVALHFWRGWRAFALCELELLLRPAGLGEGDLLRGAEDTHPGPTPSPSPGLRIVR